MASTAQNLLRADALLAEAALILQQNVGIAITAGVDHCGYAQDEEHGIFQMVSAARRRTRALVDYTRAKGGAS